MLKALLVIALKLLGDASLPSTHPVVVRASDAARDVLLAVGEGDRAKLLMTWSFYESGWFTNPKGFSDNGASCGVMQLQTPEKWLPGATCARVKVDRVLGYKAANALIDHLVAKCDGSLRQAMTAYATDGQCHKGWKLGLVTRRCKEAGINCD